MKYTIGDIEEYKDEVVYDLLFFLQKNINSKEDVNTWYTDIDNQKLTSLNELFDKEQSLYFNNHFGSLSIRKLENNKLLTIVSTTDKFRTYYVFDLYDNADKFNIKVNKIDGQIEINNGNKKEFTYALTSNNSLKKLQDKYEIKDLSTASLDQIFERSKKEESITKNESKSLKKNIKF